MGGSGGSGAASATTSGHIPLELHGDSIEAADNDLGIMGTFFTSIDNSGQFDEEPELEVVLDRDDTKLCVSGSTGWADESLAGIYAADLSLYFNQPSEEDLPPYAAASHGVVGFSFVLDTIPAGGVLFYAMDTAVVWRCLELDRPGRHDVLFEDLEECSSLDGPLHLDRLHSVGWEFAWPGGDALPIAMCVAGFAAIVR